MTLSSGLIRGCFGAALGCKTEENEVFRFTDLRGHLIYRGAARRMLNPESNYRRQVASFALREVQ